MAQSAITLQTLTQRADFVRIAREGRRITTAGLALEALACPPDLPQGIIRIGYTASSRMGNAVERNRIKRRLRALAQKILPSFGLLGYDFVLVGRTATLTREFFALEKDLKFALHTIKGK